MLSAAVDAGAAAPPPARAGGRWTVRLALLCSVLAFCLRSCALSHGPDPARRYHPDTHKQVDAAGDFLEGDYLIIRDIKNYDGYPLFNAHLVEGLVRVFGPAARSVLSHVGAAGRAADAGPPSITALYWITLLWNALMSAAAAGIAVLLGARFGVLAGFVAGAFAALSPLDVVAAHYATGDTASAFFALVTVYLGVRILETGRVRHYVLGSLALAAAFSAKYNGGEAGIALAAAHLLRHPGRSAFASAAAWRRIGAALAAGVAGLLLTSPALLVNFDWALASIPRFMAHVANYGMTSEQLQLPFVQRLAQGLRDNGLFFLQFIGVAAAVGIAVALVALRRLKTLWVVAALPLAHLVVVFLVKQVAHPVHHLPAAVPLLVLAAAGIGSLLARPAWQRAAGALLAVAAVASLSSAVRSDLFFFSRSEVGRVAAAWARDSIPAQVAVRTTRNTFTAPPLPAAPERGAVTFLAPQFFRPPGPGRFLMADFALERHSLSVFRNIEIRAVAAAPDLLAPGFSLPVWQPLPSAGDEDLAFVDVPVFYRSPLVRDVEPRLPFSLTVVSRGQLDRAWLLARAAGETASLAVDFGGRGVRRVLHPGELAVIPVERPRTIRSSHEGNDFYEWTGRVAWGRARVALVTDPAVLGRHLFNAGRFEEAWRSFSESSVRPEPVGQRLERAIAGVAAGVLDAAGARALAGDVLAVGSWSADELMRRFGIHPDWLDALPYLKLAGDDLSPVEILAADYPQVAAPAGATSLRGLEAVQLLIEPGRYAVEISAPPGTGPLLLGLRDVCWRVAGAAVAVPTADGGAAAVHRAVIEFPPSLAAFSLQVLPSDAGAPPAGLTLSLRPDPVGTVQGRVDLLRRLLAGGAAPRARTVPLAPGHPAVARFRNGVELVSYRVDAPGLQPGGELDVVLDWRLPVDLHRPDLVQVWVHALDGQGGIAFQGDHPLLADLRASRGGDAGSSCYPSIAVPPGTPPGAYELRAGLWLPYQKRKIRLKSAAGAHDRYSVSLGSIVISP